MNDLQQLSAMALWGACVLYTIAMVAYAIRLARVAELKGTAVAERKAAVNAGPAAATASAATSSVDEAALKQTAADRQTSDRKANKALGIARAATLVGAIMQIVGVTARGIEAGHVPWSTMYEYTISGSLVAVLVFLIVQRKRDITYLGAGVTGLAAISLGLGLTVLYEDVVGLQPALQSFWLVIHVSIATIATGIFGVAFIASVLQLMRDYRGAGARAFRGKAFRFLEAVPAPKKLEALAFRLNAVGFVLWTFTVIAGAIWAEHAWGRYWGWDPKEIWSFVIWVIYAAYLHARTTQGWAGRRSAYLAIFGFVAIIMNFTVVNLVFQGLHSYAKA